MFSNSINLVYIIYYLMNKKHCSVLFHFKNNSERINIIYLFYVIRHYNRRHILLSIFHTEHYNIIIGNLYMLI